VNLLESVRATPGVKSVVNVTSDKCYENKEWPWGYRENDPMGGYDPYSNSKGCAELVTACYRNTYFNPDKYAEHGVAIASARAGNVIGGGDWAEDRLVPDMIRAISKGESVEIRNPDAIRPWQHVLEPLSGYLKLAEKLHSNGTGFAEGWNFGPHDHEAKTVGWAIERLTQVWGSGAKWSLDHQQHPHEATYLKLDCSKARSRLDWHPVWNIDLTIEKIVEWHKAFNQGADMHQMTLSQINSFQTP
jgi:CDP-glucose 4,6-dehydratase